jgi:outer membrane protein OmpA-like peptidoglycan-associated protein
MSTFNLLDMAKSYFSNDLLSKASSQLGESESGISKVISAAIPTLIGTIADKASSLDGAAVVLKMATEQNDSGVLDSLGGFFNSDSNSNLISKGSGILGSLFGNGGQSNMLTTLISSFADVKGSSVGTILSMAAPALLGMIGKHASDNNVSASSIGSLLSSQKDAAMKMLPAGFSLPAFTGSTSSVASSVSSAASSTYDNVEEKASNGTEWLLPLILLIVLSTASYYFFKEGCTKPDNTETVTTGVDTTNVSATSKETTIEAPLVDLPKITVDSITGVINYDLGAMGDVELPGGVKLIGVAANGFENTLINFLKNGTIDTVNKKANWFTMHDVQFMSGKTEYATPKAMAQIRNIAAILKAYPNAVLKIGGYTDITGDAAKNKALSQTRADKLMKDIVANGAAATQIKEAVGYGSEFAVANAGDKEGMARDRRTAAKVSSK